MSTLLNSSRLVNRRSVGSLLFVVAFSACLVFTTTAAIAQNWTGNGDGVDWHDPANWDSGAVPNGTANVGVAVDPSATQTANISTANAAADGLFVGVNIGASALNAAVNHSAFTGSYNNIRIGTDGATGTYNQTGTSVVNTPGSTWIGFDNGNGPGTGHYNLNDTASLTSSDFVLIGTFPGDVGTMTLNGNSVVNANKPGDVSIVVGRENATGTLNIHDSAALNAADRIHVGDFAGAHGTVNQTGGTVNSGVTWLGNFDAGGQGTEGTYNISGSAIHNTNQVIVGRDGGKGTLKVEDTALVDINDALIIGDFNGGNGTVNQSGGTVDAGQWVGVGNQAGTTGEYNLTGGILNVGTRIDDDLKVGDSGVGTFNQSGISTVNVQRDLVVSAAGSSAGSVYTQDAGNVNVGLNGGAWLIVGRDDQSNGTYNLNGGNIDARDRIVIGADAGSDGSMVMGANVGTIDTGNSLNIGRHGNGSLDQLGGTINTQFVDIGGDGGTADMTGTSRYTMSGGILNAANAVRIGLNINSGAPFTSGFNVVGTADVNVTGNLEVSIDGNAHFLTQGSNATIDIGGNLDANSANVAQLIWGTDGGGINTINVGGDVDVTGANLLLQLIDHDGSSTGLITQAQTTPGDLLLIDNQGANPVTGLLTFDPLLGTQEELSEGELLVDDGPLQLLNGLQYRITYQGGIGGNDVILQLVPEPASMAMLGLGATLFGLVRRRR